MKNKTKTRKSVSKRIKVTGSGKFLIRNMSAQHRVKGKSKRVRLASRKKHLLHPSEVKKIKRALPYLKSKSKYQKSK